MFRYRTDYLSFFFFLLVHYVITLPLITGIFYFGFWYMGWISAATPLFIFLVVAVMIVLAIMSYRVVRNFAQERDVKDLGFR
ncbi:hypothetical protein DQG23_00135 [Paenibacillus contaminans]|uniref:Uncharacterized protein n=1 Tax=Paenibacillus contaminans TaxID=450362 RepID=A0A329MS96_9BACL|nr:hypothetical protein DQG23_00135 [Paenibacillus contaminans]